MVKFESYHLQVASALRAQQALSVAGTHLVRLAKATFRSDFTSPDANFDSAIINLVGSSSQPEFRDLVTQASELNRDFAQ